MSFCDLRNSSSCDCLVWLLFVICSCLTSQSKRSFTLIPSFRQRAWPFSGPQIHVEDFFVPPFTIRGYHSGHLCSLSNCGPTLSASLADLYFSFGFHSLIFHPVFEISFVFGLFFFWISSTLLCLWSDSNTSHYECCVIFF